jgi:hypothetical protein
MQSGLDDFRCLDSQLLLALSPDAALVLVQVGDALVVVPHEEALAAVTQRLEAVMQSAGSDVEGLIAAAAEARGDRARRVRRRDGKVSLPDTLQRVFPDSNVLIEGLFAPWSASRHPRIGRRPMRLLLDGLAETG